MSTPCLLLRLISLKTQRFGLFQHMAASGSQCISESAALFMKINNEKVEIVLYLNFTTIHACPIKTDADSLKPKVFSLI